MKQQIYVDSPNKLKAWMSAGRLRTIPIPTIQVLTGTVLASIYVPGIDWLLFFYTWIVATSITLGTNLINDVFDFDRGGDKPNRFGHQKVISAGLISRKMVYLAGMICFCIALISAIPLSIHGGWWILPLILICVLAGYGYTGGPYPLCYNGLSEFFILIFYGWIAVMGSFYIQTGYFTGTSFLCATQMGLLAILPNALNNFRDIHEDAEIKKHTLAVRFGQAFAKRELTLLTIIPFVLNLLWFFAGLPEAALIPFFLIPLSLLFVRCVWTTAPGPLFNRFFALSVAVHFGFGFLLILGFLLS